MTLLRTKSLALFALATLIPKPVLAQDPAFEGPIFDDAAYVCANGMEIDTRSIMIDGLGAVAVSFPDGRSPTGIARQLLPRTQSGSGMRYASDIASLHLDGRDVFFEASASFLSEKVERTRCERLGPFGSAILTQGARNGAYHYLAPLQPEGAPYYAINRRAENICFAKDGSAAFVLAPLSDGRRAQLVQISDSGRSVQTVTVGPVDAGAGQRRYTLADPQSGYEIGALHFSAQGTADPGDTNAAALFSGLTLHRERTDCLEMEHDLYTALTPDGIVQVSLKDDQLKARFALNSGEVVSFSGGYQREEGREAEYWFFDGERRLTVSIRAGAASISGVTMEDWIRRELTPLAFFSVGPHALSERGLAEIDRRTAELINDLIICNHFAGEFSGNSDRDAQIAAASGRIGCAQVPERHAEALRSNPKLGSLRDFLITNAPSWLP